MVEKQGMGLWEFLKGQDRMQGLGDFGNLPATCT